MHEMFQKFCTFKYFFKIIIWGISMIEFGLDFDAYLKLFKHENLKIIGIKHILSPILLETFQTEISFVKNSKTVLLNYPFDKKYQQGISHVKQHFQPSKLSKSSTSSVVEHFRIKKKKKKTERLQLNNWNFSNMNFLNSTKFF